MHQGIHGRQMHSLVSKRIHVRRVGAVSNDLRDGAVFLENDYNMVVTVWRGRCRRDRKREED